MQLIDTNVPSVAAPTKAVPRHDLRDWMNRNSAGLYLSVITVAEVEQGIIEADYSFARFGETRRLDQTRIESIIIQ